MKALSLTQPWATLIALGAKRVETRSWSTAFRGTVAIHASKGFPKTDRERCQEPPFFTVLHPHGYGSVLPLPTGAVVAIARIIDVRPIDMGLRAVVLANLNKAFGAYEIDFGDYATGRFAWFLDDIRPLPFPVPAKGALGLWDWQAPEGVA